MKNEVVEATHVKPIKKKLQKFYLQVITDACVKIIDVLNYTHCTVAVHCWYIKCAFAGFFQQILKKKMNSEVI